MAKLMPATSGKCLVMFLPQDYVAHLAALASMTPSVRIHPDISLAQQVAYLSWSAPAIDGELPMTRWVKVSDLLGTPTLKNVVYRRRFGLAANGFGHLKWYTTSSRLLIRENVTDRADARLDQSIWKMVAAVR